MIIAWDTNITVIAVIDIWSSYNFAWLTESRVDFILLGGFFSSWGKSRYWETNIEIRKEEKDTTNNHNNEPKGTQMIFHIINQHDKKRRQGKQGYYENIPYNSTQTYHAVLAYTSALHFHLWQW